MNKPRLLALTILVLAAAVALPAADDLWHWVVYEEDTSGSVTTGLVFGTAHPLAAEGDFDRVEHKRAEWLPGRDWILSSVCGQCVGGLHGKCTSGNEALISHTNIQTHPKTDVLMFQCTCTDRSHE